MAAKIVTLDEATTHNLQIWSKIRSDQAALAVIELDYREAIIKGAPFNQEKQYGTQTINVDDKFKIELDRPLNYTVAKDVPTVMEAVTALHAVNPAAAATIIRWEAVLSVGTYNKLTDDEKKLIAPILNAKPGLPAINIAPVKKEV